MDFEPSAKRRRTLSPELGQPYSGDPYPAQFLEEPAEDDEAYKLYLERAFADPRFRDTVAKIFDKYGQKNAQDTGSLAGAAAGELAQPEPVDPMLSSLTADPDISQILNIDEGATETETRSGTVETLQQQQPKDAIPDDAAASTELEVADYQVERQLNTGSGEFPAHNFGPGMPPFDPRFAMMPTWYGPFPPGTHGPPAWEGYPMSFNMPGTMNGPWSAPNGFMYAPGPWPQAFSSAPHPGQLPVQEDEPKEKSTSPATDDKTPLMPPPPPPSKPGKGPHPRFSKNGKRLGRPPKSNEVAENISSTLPKEMNDVAAYDGEGEDNGAARTQHSPSKADDAVEVEDDDADLFWEDIADVMGQTAAAVNLVGKKGAILSMKRRNELLSGSDAEEDPEVVEKEQELRKLYKQLMSCKTQDSTDDQNEENEGRRRSGRERKRVDFPDKVSWKKFCAERRVKHKITMALRSLAAKDRRLRQQQTQANGEADADVNNNQTEPAEHGSEHNAADGATKPPPKSTIPDSQESVTTLPIRSPAKPTVSSDSEALAKQNNIETKRNDEDCLFSDDEAPAFLSKTSLPKPQFPVDASPKLGGATFCETIYALSDDECPATLNVKPKSRIEPATASLPEQANKERQTAAPAMTTTEPDAEAVYKRPIQRARKLKAKPTRGPENETQAIMEQLEDMAVDYPSMDEAPKLASESEAARKPSPPSEVTENLEDSGIDLAGEQTEAADLGQEDFVGAVDALTGDVEMTDDSNLLETLDAATDTAATSLPSDDGKSAKDGPSPVSSPLLPAIDMDGESGMEKKTPSPKPPASEEDCRNKTASPVGIQPQRSSETPQLQGETRLTPAKHPEPEDEAEVVTFMVHSDPTTPKNDASKPARKTPPLGQLFVSPPSRSALPSSPVHKAPKQPHATPAAPTTTRKASSERTKPPTSGSRASSASRSSNGKISSSRRSLLSLIGDDDLDDFNHRGESQSKPRRYPWSEKHHSHRVGKLVSMSSSSSKAAKPDKHSSTSKEKRRKEKEKRRHSSYEPSANKGKSKAKEAVTSTTLTGTCGVDGYTCGREFCFTCL